MRNTTFGARVNNWALLNDAVKAQLANLPTHVQALQQQLEDLITRARDVENLQESARAQLTEQVHTRQEIEVEGERLRTQMGALLRGVLGNANDKLWQYGIRPRVRAARRNTATEGTNPPVTEITTP